MQVSCTRMNVSPFWTITDESVRSIRAASQTSVETEIIPFCIDYKPVWFSNGRKTSLSLVLLAPFHQFCSGRHHFDFPITLLTRSGKEKAQPALDRRRHNQATRAKEQVPVAAEKSVVGLRGRVYLLPEVQNRYGCTNSQLSPTDWFALRFSHTHKHTHTPRHGAAQREGRQTKRQVVIAKG